MDTAQDKGLKIMEAVQDSAPGTTDPIQDNGPQYKIMAPGTR